jgi:hypothetical protein
MELNIIMSKNKIKSKTKNSNALDFFCPPGWSISKPYCDICHKLKKKKIRYQRGKKIICYKCGNNRLVVKGCTDSIAVNYNPAAVCDDGGCIYAGCTDPNAINHNPKATIDDGSCTYTGCTDPSATNYNPKATIDDGSCYSSTLCGKEGPYNGNGSYGCYKYIIFTDWDDCLYSGNPVYNDHFIADGVLYEAPSWSEGTDGHRAYEINNDGITATCINATGSNSSAIGDVQNVTTLLGWASPGCPDYGCCDDSAGPFTLTNSPGCVLSNSYTA